MTTPSSGPQETSTSDRTQPRDAAYWAHPTDRLKVSNVPTGALNLNVDGRRAMGPLQGFGKLWQKTYQIRLEGVDVSPEEVIRTWKHDFPKFWGAKGNRFYAPITGLAPGEVVLINGHVPGGARMSTGIMVMYADDESFTFMTPEGHPFAGWVTFSAYKSGEATVVQAQVLIRPTDPLWELAMPLGLGRLEDNVWLRTLASVAAHFGVDAKADMKAVVIDRKYQWAHARNIWRNVGIRAAVYTCTSPARRALLLLRRRGA